MVRRSGFYKKKVYGSSKRTTCPFCGKEGLYKNDEGFFLCKDHKGEQVGVLRCLCGSLLELKNGRYGLFFLCMNCGPISYERGLEINDLPLRSIEEL